jgi:CHASE3 domain sensor protein
MRSREAGSVPPGTVQAHGLRQWWLNQSVRAKGLIVVAVPLIALMALTSANLVLQRDETTERTVSLNARAQVAAAGQVLADAVNGETGIRGYAATRDPLFLAPYTLALTRIAADRATLRKTSATEGLGRQQQTVDATTGTVLRQLAQLRSATSRGITAENLIPLMKNQKATMDRLRVQVASLANAPAALVTIEHNKLTTLQTRTVLLDIAGLAVGLLAGLAGVALFTSGVARRIGVNAENARRLGEGQPLEPIPFAVSRTCGPRRCWPGGPRT